MADTSGIPIVETPVLVIGSSMVGMTLSSLLAQHGISDCITVEKHASTAIHPRAAYFHPRTMQIYRELGLYEQMKQESYKYYDEHAGIYDVESLAGREIGRYMEDLNEGLERISPTSRLFLTQQMFEPLLRAHATKHGADLRFSTELLEFQHDATGVSALIRNTATGAKQLVRAKYLVACDGNRSFVRQKIGIRMQGHGLLSHSLTIYFKADLGRFVQGKYNGVIYVNNAHIRGFFRLDKTGREGFLAVNTAGERGTEASRFPAVNITNERASEMLRAAIGADVEYEITLLSPWDAVCDVAERFQVDRILLAGDAAHIVTPNGGFGGNTGIQDAHNLAWKLALVLKGQAGGDLISTYEAERWPVAKKTVDQVFERYIVRTAPEFRQEGMEVEEEVPEPHLELGYQYHSQGLATKGLPGGSVTSDPATATAEAGTMAHHVLVTTTDQTESPARPIAGLLGRTFVLVAGRDGGAWVRAARELSRKEDSTLPEVVAHQLAADGNESFYEKYSLLTSGCVLIRPDGFVAWAESKAAATSSGTTGISTTVEMLEHVLRGILCLSSSPGMQDFKSKM
ncbi:hypothetical protein LTR08_007317 [Meristemomyces frigidus]|nr:hypothetical protein LTR08_007317 [Meristemomyces frigidus]